MTAILLGERVKGFCTMVSLTITVRAQADRVPAVDVRRCALRYRPAAASQGRRDDRETATVALTAPLVDG
ncbi:hypothetical protein [Phenylobacterium sp.]|uniref:hypothetical protein n=1 Tax=Phenylobacterium sp. TaxID=1871053 RepID=UPI0025F75D17|nr:hypothetical protein [Phenylobacterium sp.]